MKKFFYIATLFLFSTATTSAQVQFSNQIKTPNFEYHVEKTCLATVAKVEQSAKVHEITHREAKKSHKKGGYAISYDEGKNWYSYSLVEGDNMVEFYDSYFYCINKQAFIRETHKTKTGNGGAFVGGLAVGGAVTAGAILVGNGTIKL